MAFKIHIEGNKFYIDDLEGELLRYEGLAKDVLSRTKTPTSTDFGFTNVNNWSNTRTISFSEIDLTGAAYTDLASFNEWLESNLGNSNGGGSGSGASSFSGWIDYNDSSPLVSLSADTWVDIPNNGAGSFSNRSPLPLAGGITELINTLTGALVFSDFKIGDYAYIRHDFSVVPDTNNATLEFRYFVGQTGQEYPLNISIPRLDRGSGIPYQETGLFFIYMGDENTRLGGARLQVRLSTTGTLSNNGMVINYNIY